MRRAGPLSTTKKRSSTKKSTPQVTVVIHNGSQVDPTHLESIKHFIKTFMDLTDRFLPEVLVDKNKYFGLNSFHKQYYKSHISIELLTDLESAVRSLHNDIFLDANNLYDDYLDVLTKKHQTNIPFFLALLCFYDILAACDVCLSDKDRNYLIMIRLNECLYWDYPLSPFGWKQLYHDLNQGALYEDNTEMLHRIQNCLILNLFLVPAFKYEEYYFDYERFCNINDLDCRLLESSSDDYDDSELVNNENQENQSVFYQVVSEMVENYNKSLVIEQIEKIELS